MGIEPKTSSRQTRFRVSAAAAATILLHLPLLLFDQRDIAATTQKGTMEKVYVIPDGGPEQSPAFSAAIENFRSSFILSPDARHGFSALKEERKRRSAPEPPDPLGHPASASVRQGFSAPLHLSERLFSCETIVPLSFSPVLSADIFTKGQVDRRYPMVFDGFGRSLKQLSSALAGLDPARAKGHTEIEFRMKGPDRIISYRTISGSSDAALDADAARAMAPLLAASLAKSGEGISVIRILWRE